MELLKVFALPIILVLTMGYCAVKAADVMGGHVFAAADAMGAHVEKGLASLMSTDGAGQHLMATGFEHLAKAVQDRKPFFSFFG